MLKWWSFSSCVSDGKASHGALLGLLGHFLSYLPSKWFTAKVSLALLVRKQGGLWAKDSGVWFDFLSWVTQVTNPWFHSFRKCVLWMHSTMQPHSPFSLHNSWALWDVLSVSFVPGCALSAFCGLSHANTCGRHRILVCLCLHVYPKDLEQSRAESWRSMRNWSWITLPHCSPLRKGAYGWRIWRLRC